MSSDEIARRIEKTVYAGQPAWIKRPELQRSNIYAFLHRCFAMFLPAALRPTGARGGMTSLLQEAERLKAFSAMSVLVPDVLEVTDEHIVLSDCGPQLRNVLRQAAGRHEVQRLLDMAVINLAALHTQKLTHGRPHLKDMTFCDGRIYLLDLEEDPQAVMDLGDAQARDIWLLLGSCVEFCENPLADLKVLLSLYQSNLQGDINPHIRALGRDLRGFRKFIGFVRASNASRDVSGAYWATKVFEDV